MTRLKSIGLGALMIGWCASFAWPVVPSQPSKVTVSGTQLLVQKRLRDGTLSPQVAYTIKGVDWSPATRAPDNGPDPSQGGKSVPYGFFFDDVAGNRWRFPGLEGHDLMALWLQQEFLNHDKQDIPLMAQMHVNTVRLYGDFGDDPSVYGPILDELYNNGIMVIMSLPNSKAEVDSGRYLRIMQICQNHPAILMWAIGNEWNLTNPIFYGYPDFATATSSLNSVAHQMKAQDPNHPVSSSLGDRFTGGLAGGSVPGIVSAMPEIDIWALNVYRGPTFSDLFTQWASASSKPFYFSEFGVDSFQTTAYTVQGGNQAHVTAGFEDPGTQSSWDLGLWNLIQPQLSRLDSTKSCVGGFVFSFNDNYWKVGNFNVGLGNLPTSDYTGATHYKTQNMDGFVLPGGFPDSVDNEEHFGIVSADRVPKQAYRDLQAYYATLAPLPLASVVIAAPSASLHFGQTQQFMARGLDVFEEPLVAQPVITWSISPSNDASINSSGVFTAGVTPGTYWITATNGVFVSSVSVVVSAPTDLSALRVFPSPWRSDIHAGRDITFDGLTMNTTVKIFTLSGHWVRTLGPADLSLSWNLKNDAGDTVASGLYFYLVTNDQGQKDRGKLAVIR